LYFLQKVKITEAPVFSTNPLTLLGVSFNKKSNGAKKE